MQQQKKYLKIPKGATRNRKSRKDKLYNGQKKKGQTQTVVYKALHRKLNIENHVAH